MSLEASLSALNAELSGTRGWMRDVAERQQSDHDDIIRLQGASQQHGRDIATMRSEMARGLRSVRDEVRDGLAAVRKDLKDYKDAQKKKADEEAKEARGRNWALIMAVLGPFISAIMTAIATYLIARGG